MQRHILSAWNFLSVSSLVVPVIAVSNAGCNSQAVTPLEASIEVPARDAPVADVSIQDDSPPAPASANKVAAPVPAFFLPPQTGQLIEAIDRSLAETPAIPVEVEDLQQLEHGLDAAEDLILRNSDPVTVEAAWRSKLTLLYRGARKGQSDYSERLAAAARSVAETSFTRQVEYAHALNTGSRYFHLEIPVHEVAGRLTDHVHRFPNGRYSARLFLAYARRLAAADRRDDATAICQAGLWELHGHTEIEHIRYFLKTLEHAEPAEKTDSRPGNIQNLMLDQVAQGQASLPLQIDELTVLYEIATADRMVIYRYRVTLDPDEFETEMREFEETVRHRAWESPATRKMLESGIQLRYDYFSLDAELLGSFTVRQAPADTL